MSDQRFRPPNSDVRDQPREKGSAIKGLVAGFLVDVVGTLLFSIVVGLVYGVLLAGTGRSEQEIQAALANSATDPWVSGIGVVGGSAFSILGGFVCERIARRGNYRLGALLAGIGAGLGVLLGGSSDSIAESALLTFLTFGSILLGTRLAIEKHGL